MMRSVQEQMKENHVQKLQAAVYRIEGGGHGINQLVVLSCFIAAQKSFEVRDQSNATGSWLSI